MEEAREMAAGNPNVVRGAGRFEFCKWEMKIAAMRQEIISAPDIRHPRSIKRESGIHRERRFGKIRTRILSTRIVCRRIGQWRYIASRTLSCYVRI